MSRITSARFRGAGKVNRMCTWFAVPPIARMSNLQFLAIPRILGPQGFGIANELCALFCAEDTMDVVENVRAGHSAIPPCLANLRRNARHASMCRRYAARRSFGGLIPRAHAHGSNKFRPSGYRIKAYVEGQVASGDWGTPSTDSTRQTIAATLGAGPRRCFSNSLTMRQSNSLIMREPWLSLAGDSR